MAILMLNKSTVKLITSTQIITSVSSVVKELVENSLDADAKNIEISLSDNGLSMIEIRDDGSGVSVADVPNMALPYRTSKILEFADLDSLNTYGFRGEALNAICRVAADVTVTTKTSRDEMAKTYNLDKDGNIVGTELSSRSNGTTVRVKKLFDNVPVRRQMIGEQRKSKQDVKYIESLLKCLSVCNPTVRISYRVNSNLVFLKPSCVDAKEALGYLLGSKVIANLEWIHYEDSEMRIQLMIPKKELNELHLVYESNERYVVVNNRPVKYKQFEKAINDRIAENFGAKAPPKKRAIYFINITVSPDEIDVNLEPDKTSVLLKNQDTILKKLDNVLVEFYNLCDENTRPENSSIDTSIDGTSEYHDLSNGIIKVSEIEVPPACKKIKLNNNKQRRSRDFIVDLIVDTGETKRKTADRKSAEIDSSLVFTPSEKITRSKPPPDTWKDDRNVLTEISGETVRRYPHEDSMGSGMMRNFPGPDLSDSDVETNLASLKSSRTEFEVDHAARQMFDSASETETVFKNSESFALSSGNPSYEKSFDERNASAIYPSDNCDESLSQLPVVDLGEDFDIEAILKKPGRALETRKSTDPSTTNEDNNPSKETENIEKPEITLELWSKGQIPGLKDPTSVSVLNNPENKPGSSKENQSKQGDATFQTIYHTGFSKFSHEIRSQVIEENPDATLPTIGKIFANRWKELSPEERGYYRDLALEEKRKAEAEKKKIKNNKLSQQEADKNKTRLIQMLETMKKTKTTKKCSINERTAIPWEITIQNITESFFAKEPSELERIIGRLTDEIWAVKFDEKICVAKSSEVFKDGRESTDLEEQQSILTSESSRTILTSWLREKKIHSSLLHPIHSIVSSSSIVELER